MVFVQTDTTTMELIGDTVRITHEGEVVEVPKSYVINKMEELSWENVQIAKNKLMKLMVIIS